MPEQHVSVLCGIGRELGSTTLAGVRGVARRFVGVFEGAGAKMNQFASPFSGWVAGLSCQLQKSRLWAFPVCLCVSVVENHGDGRR